MKAVSYADGKVKTSNIKKPIGDGVVVNVSSAGICGSDLHLLNSGAHSPHIAGHEISGITENGKHVAMLIMIRGDRSSINQITLSFLICVRWRVREVRERKSDLEILCRARIQKTT